MNTQKQIFLMVALMFIFVGGCAAYTVVDIPVRAKDQTDWHKDQSVERGALLFANNCRTCHGIQGQGGVGPQLNKPDFQNQDPLVLQANRALIKRTLVCGRAGTLMPAWLNTNGGALNERQIEHLVDLITQAATVEDESGNVSSKGWLEAVEFAHNLNHETTAVVGGETLGSVAKEHQVGLDEVVKLTNAGATQIVPKGTKITLPDGRRYQVRTTNETPAKIADQQHVGAVILAELNGIPYRIDAKSNRFELLDPQNAKALIPGLFPGTKLKLPAGAVYVIKAGDTLQKIADHHGLQVSAITGEAANRPVLSTTDATKELAFQRTLALPANSVALVQTGQTLAAIATLHALKPEDLAAAAGVDAAAPLQAGQALKLPNNTRYVVQSGDTLAAVAVSHNLTPQALAAANDLQPNATIAPDLVLRLPKVDAYVLQGQTLEDVAAGFSNVTAASLAQANGGIPANAILRVGQNLALPADAWGSAPPDARNPGTACVQHAVPDAVFKVLPGVGTPEAAAEAPTTVSKVVRVLAGANDWRVSADGTVSSINKGVVLVAKGTGVEFTSESGLHTVTINGKKDNGDLKQGDKRTITFNDAGRFKITCDYHPAMLADIFVQ